MLADYGFPKCSLYHFQEEEILSSTQVLAELYVVPTALSRIIKVHTILVPLPIEGTTLSSYSTTIKVVHASLLGD